MEYKCVICEEEIVFVKKTKPSKKKKKKTCGKKSCITEMKIRTRSKIFDAVEKECKACGVTYEDTTKRKVSSYCSGCAHSAGVATRFSNGSYKRTEEQNRKLSETQKEKYASGERVVTQKEKDRFSAQTKELWASGEMLRRQRATYMAKYGVEHHSQRESERKRSAARMKDREVSAETRKRMSISAANRVRSGQELYTSGNGGKREDLGNTYFRSNWEANFARICELEGREWAYEPETFELSNGKRYTPDFLVNGVYYELKGRWTDGAKEKFDMFLTEYPEKRIDLVEETGYIIMRKKYKSLIEGWEGK